jgi:hypothetical protein
MRGAVLFGLLFGAVSVLSRALLGERLGLALMWSSAALSSGAISVVVWRRMRLGLFTVSGLSGAAACAATAWFTMRGYTLETIPAPWLLAIVVAYCLMLSGMLFERRQHSEKWEAWRRASEHAGLIDMLRFRHVPDLRNHDSHG